MIEFDPLKTPAQQAEWKKLNDDLLKRLTGKIFPKELFDRVRAMAKS
jgi:hypothetical protein